MKRVIQFLLIQCLLLFSFNSALAVTASLLNPDDSYLRSTSPTTNYGSEPVLIADGVSQDPDNGIYGEVVTVVQWNVASIPSTATVTGVNVIFNYSDASSAPYEFHAQESAWSEGSVTWNDLNEGANILGTIPAFTFGQGTHPLNASGIALVQGWIDGSINNNGLVVRTSGTNNGIAMDSKEGGRSPVLEITYTDVKSYFHTVSPCAFRGRDSTEKTICGTGQGGTRYEGTSNFGIAAPVNLPHGAVIKNITVHFKDESFTARLWVRFSRESLSAGFFSLIGQGFSTNGTGYQSISFPPEPVISHTIDNQTSSLVITASSINEADFSSASWPTDNTLMLKGVVIEYTLPEN